MKQILKLFTSSAGIILFITLYISIIPIEVTARFTHMTVNPHEITSQDLEFTLKRVDSDGDGIVNYYDNCPAAYNPSQIDIDNNGDGDACDLTPYPYLYASLVGLIIIISLLIVLLFIFSSSGIMNLKKEFLKKKRWLWALVIALMFPYFNTLLSPWPLITLFLTGWKDGIYSFLMPTLPLITHIFLFYIVLTLCSLFIQKIKQNDHGQM